MYGLPYAANRCCEIDDSLLQELGFENLEEMQRVRREEVTRQYSREGADCQGQHRGSYD